jgi:hypothetical protein
MTNKYSNEELAKNYFSATKGTLCSIGERFVQRGIIANCDKDISEIYNNRNENKEKWTELKRTELKKVNHTLIGLILDKGVEEAISVREQENNNMVKKNPFKELPSHNSFCSLWEDSVPFSKYKRSFQKIY